jgi:two-component system chemotaxis response regulator CheY
MDTVLIVDDSRTIQKQVSQLVLKFYPNYKIITCSSGEEAMLIIPDIKNQIAVAIFDFNMNGMTGLELVDKSKSYIDQHRIILCTANIQEAIQNKAQELGVHFKEKPLTSDNFREIFEQVLKAA